MSKCSNLEKKKEKNKNQVLIKAKVSNSFLFWHSRHHRGCKCIYIRIDSHTIKRENLWLSDYRVPLGEVIHAYGLGASVLTINPWKVLEKC
jgi:hypothetical protein